MDLYFERCDGTAATIEDFIACFAEASGRDLSQFMRWYEQAGTPTLTVTSAYDEATRSLTLTLAQSSAPTPGQPEKKPLVIPVALGLVGDNGDDLTLTTPAATAEGGARETECANGVFELTDAHRTIRFLDLPARPVASILRGFSAPVRLETDTSEKDLLAQAARDTDLFNRWQALQTYASRLLINSVARIRTGGLPLADAEFADAVGKLLASWMKDPAFTALAISLPAEADIARDIARDVDPDAIHLARRELRRALATQLRDQLVTTYETLNAGKNDTLDAVGAGRRALRNAVLDLCIAADPDMGTELAMRQFQSAHNMTDQFGALAALSLVKGDRREKALDTFYRGHASDPLVIDKWFALQAQITERGVIDRVRDLMRHHAFSYTNPNRLRSLIGSFAGNLTQFHAADGRGYDLLASVVLDLDPKNPQVAARLLVAFRTWRSMEAQRRAHAEAALRRVAATQGLSADVRDIVDRSLA
jgi:aminopeptidase N